MRLPYPGLAETGAWFHHARQQLLVAGLSLTVPTLVNRTWEQALQAVQDQIDVFPFPARNDPGPA